MIRNMKRIIAALLAAVLLFTDCASGFAAEVKPELERYAGLVQQIKEKSKERKALLAEKKETPFYQIPKLHDLTRRITELTEKLEELKTEKEMLLRSLDCAADMDAAELMDARLAVREEKERSAVDRVKAAYSEKYDPMMMHDSRRDVTNLLHEEAEVRSVREVIRWKQQQQAQQKQNKKKNRDSWER